MITICIVFTQNTKQGLTWIFPWSHPRVRFAGLISFAIYWKKKKKDIRENGEEIRSTTLCTLLPCWTSVPTLHGKGSSAMVDLSVTSSLHMTGLCFWISRLRGLTFTLLGWCGFYVEDMNQPSLPNPFYSVLVSISVFMALSTVFHSINPPDNSPLLHSFLPVLILPDWSFQQYVSLWKSPSALI